MAQKRTTPTIEARIFSALRRSDGGPLTVAQLHAHFPGLIGRRSREISAACEQLVNLGFLYPGFRKIRFVGVRWTYHLAMRDQRYLPLKATHAQQAVATLPPPR